MGVDFVENTTNMMDPEENMPNTIYLEIFYVIIAILGITGNGLVLIVIIKVPDLRSITNILIGHQSLIDVVSSSLLLLTFFPPTIDLSVLGDTHPALANFLCKVWMDQFLYWGVIKVSTFNLICLTLERYFAVVYPHKYRQRASKKGALCICFLGWFVGPFSEFYFLFTFAVDESNVCSKRDLPHAAAYAIAFMVFIFTLVLPLSIMAFVYVSIIKVLRPIKPAMQTASTAQLNRSHSPEANRGNKVITVSNNITLQNGTNSASTAPSNNEQPPAKSAVRTVRERARRNVLTTMFLVSLTYAICWTPNQIIYFYYNLIMQTDFSGALYGFTIILAATNVCVNPMIYAFKYTKFQQGLRQVFLRQSPTVWETTATDPS